MKLINSTFFEVIKQLYQTKLLGIINTVRIILFNVTRLFLLQTQRQSYTDSKTECKWWIMSHSKCQMWEGGATLEWWPTAWTMGSHPQHLTYTNHCPSSTNWRLWLCLQLASGQQFGICSSFKYSLNFLTQVYKQSSSLLKLSYWYI